MSETLEVFFGNPPKRAECSWSDKLEVISEDGARKLFYIIKTVTSDHSFAQIEWVLPSGQIELITTYQYNKAFLKCAIMNLVNEKSIVMMRFLPRATAYNPIHFMVTEFIPNNPKTEVLNIIKPEFDSDCRIFKGVMKDVKTNAVLRKYELVRDDSGKVIKEIETRPDGLMVEYLCDKNEKVSRIIKSKT